MQKMGSHPHNYINVTPARREILIRRIRLFVLFTISYNIVEATVSLAAGGVLGSGALIGFGLDSAIEVISAAAVAWQFSSKDPEKREKITLRIVSLSFFGLTIFVGGEALVSLFLHRAPEPSPIGIVIAILSLAIMPTVSALQRRTGKELGSQSAVADSQQTLLCTYMSAVLLIGLGANSIGGYWWADPVAALIIAGISAYEGVKAWSGKVCCHGKHL